MISGLIDYVLNKDYLKWTFQNFQEIIDRAAEMNLYYHDSEAFLGYWRFMIQPLIGTQKILEYIIRLAGFDEAEIIEWFQYGGTAFHFKAKAGVVNKALPGDLGALYDFLIALISEYKNERSFLETLIVYSVVFAQLPFVGMHLSSGDDVTIYDKHINNPENEVDLKDQLPIWEVPAI